jgi:hypothetical protein
MLSFFGGPIIGFDTHSEFIVTNNHKSRRACPLSVPCMGMLDSPLVTFQCLIIGDRPFTLFSTIRMR